MLSLVTIEIKNTALVYIDYHCGSQTQLTIWGSQFENDIMYNNYKYANNRTIQCEELMCSMSAHSGSTNLVNKSMGIDCIVTSATNLIN